MRARAVVFSVLASLGILTVGWQMGASSAATSTVNPGSTTTTTGAGLKDGTYTGQSEQTRFGDVQVKVTISAGAIADVTTLKLTDREQRSVQISNYAAPILRQEVIDSQSANVQNINGATYTTDGYLASLQSALDQAS